MDSIFIFLNINSKGNGFIKSSLYSDTKISINLDNPDMSFQRATI